MSTARKIVNKLLETEMDSPEANIPRHSAEIYKERRFGAKLLAQQPESADPVYAVHFDMWNDEQDPDAEPWEWNDPRAVAQFQREIEGICNEVPNLNCDRIRELAGYYPYSGDTHTWEMLADEIVKAGYSVYHSQTFFEIYRPEDITEEENTEDPERME